MGMSSVLLRPVLIARGRVTLVLRHFVTLLRIRRVRRVGGTRRGYGGIYRYVGVRLYMWCIMMVILVSILQGHGRTCCLSHTDCTGVSLLLCVLLLSRDIRSIHRGRTRRRRDDTELGFRTGVFGKFGRPHLLRKILLCCWI